MNQEIKARWVAALRSGKYKQTKGVLRGGGGFCCLGVLCDLYAKDAGVDRWNKATLSEQADRISERMSQPGLPGAEVQMWAGLDARCKVTIGLAQDALYHHNDNGCTFPEIADAIEKQL